MHNVFVFGNLPDQHDLQLDLHLEVAVRAADVQFGDEDRPGVFTVKVQIFNGNSAVVCRADGASVQRNKPAEVAIAGIRLFLGYYKLHGFPGICADFFPVAQFRNLRELLPQRHSQRGLVLLPGLHHHQPAHFQLVHSVQPHQVLQQSPHH